VTLTEPAEKTGNRVLGKWAQPEVPHTGWRCTDIEDLGEPATICEMCEVVTIRYVHLMSHGAYPSVLRCGCICAGHMEEDLQGAKDREKWLRGVPGRRKRWLSSPQWKRGRNNAQSRSVSGFRIVVFDNLNGTFSGRVTHEGTGWVKDSKLRYETADAVKMAAFDVMIGMEKELEQFPDPALRDCPGS
jgi:hypothetical protein